MGLLIFFLHIVDSPGCTCLYKGISVLLSYTFVQGGLCICESIWWPVRFQQDMLTSTTECHSQLMHLQFLYSVYNVCMCLWGGGRGNRQFLIFWDFSRISLTTTISDVCWHIRRFFQARVSTTGTLKGGQGQILPFWDFYLKSKTRSKSRRNLRKPPKFWDVTSSLTPLRELEMELQRHAAIL